MPAAGARPRAPLATGEDAGAPGSCRGRATPSKAPPRVARGGGVSQYGEEELGVGGLHGWGPPPRAGGGCGAASAHRLSLTPCLAPSRGEGRPMTPARWRRPLGSFGWVVICPLPPSLPHRWGPRGDEEAGAVAGDGQPGGGSLAAPAASLPREVLAAIDVASVPVCVSSCVPAAAAGSPCPPCPVPPGGHGPLPGRSCAPGFGRWPRCRLSGRSDARGRAGSAVVSSPCPFCRLFVPSDWKRWRRCISRLVCATWEAGAGGFERPPEGPRGSLCCPRHPSLLSPLPQTPVPLP